MAFPRIISDLIEAFGDKQDELAKALGVSQPTISRWAAGTQKPGADSLRKALAVAASRGVETGGLGAKWNIGENVAVRQVVKPPDFTLVPVITWISAGKLVEPTTEIPTAELPHVAIDGLGAGEFFGLKVSGTSMDRISPDNSIVIVNRREQMLVEGKPFIFVVRGRATYKLWGKEPPRLEPYSTDPSNKTEFMDRKQRIDVIGRVRRSILDL